MCTGTNGLVINDEVNKMWTIDGYWRKVTPNDIILHNIERVKCPQSLGGCLFILTLYELISKRFVKNDKRWLRQENFKVIIKESHPITFFRTVQSLEFSEVCEDNYRFKNNVYWSNILWYMSIYGQNINSLGLLKDSGTS